jgi:hypothetical protein
MSNWTHVAGIVRVDGLRLNGEVKDFESIFGKEVEWESPGGLWDKAWEHPEHFLPMGSEGSLKMTVWVNPEDHCLASYTVSIFGDLRDHDDPDEIINWFKEKCKSLFVRNACITVENEWNGVRDWVYHWKDEERNEGAEE